MSYSGRLDVRTHVLVTQSLNSELVKVNPSKSVWLRDLTVSPSIGVRTGFSEMKSESKLLKSRLDLCRENIR